MGSFHLLNAGRMATMKDTAGTQAGRVNGGGSGNPFNRDALNVPNCITIFRLLLSVVLFTLIYIQGFWITSAVLFVFAASTDALDGYIARKYGLVTVLGRILDPFVDKIIVGGAFIFLSEKTVLVDGETYHSGVNAWMAIIVIGREMFVTSLRGYLEQQGRDFSANWSGKFKMALQCVAVPVALLSLNPHFREPWFLMTRDVLLWSAVVVTIASGLVYVYRAVALLKLKS